MGTEGEKTGVAEYVTALKQSEKFGRQVVAHHTDAPQIAEHASSKLLSDPIRSLLHNIGIKALYSHQAAAIEYVAAGRHVIISTATASGKSLIYNLPVIQSLLTEPQTKALYLFPLKALAQDQLKALQTLVHNLPEEVLPETDTAAIYDGDTSGYKRKKIREQLPAVLITNPDMLHLSLLPYSDKWAHFFSHLKYIIIDEVHTYRGVFGSHIAWVLRRLNRMCEVYGTQPTYILTSATVGNPEDLAQNLTGHRFVSITASGAGKAAKHTLLLNPIDSAAGAATLLLDAAVHRKLRTIIYTQSRKMTELITMWSGKRLKEYQHNIASYRAGFLPEDRRHIEKKLVTGELLAVITTSALELGIDIGALDICIMVGYPGSIMAARQRAGRVGRNNRESLVILIGHEDALDQYFMRNPEDFFARPVESVTINPLNTFIAGRHLVCAAAEIPLHREEPLLQAYKLDQQLHELTTAGELLQSANGNSWFAARKYPQRHVSIRGSGHPFMIYLSANNKIIGEIDGRRVITECHKGAIYLHMAQSYYVDGLDMEEKAVYVSPISPNYFTRVQSTKTTEILEEFSRTQLKGVVVVFGRLRVTEHITGYLKILSGSMKIIGRRPLDLPPQTFETEGYWLLLPPYIKNACEHHQLHFMGGIHAMEHALIGLMPLLVLCDRNDIGGISHPWHDQIEGAAVFVYDGHAGGVGLAREAFSHIHSLVESTLNAVRSCSCDAGCPSCVHSSKCGSGNRPIDKNACVYIMEALLKPPPASNSTMVEHPPLPALKKTTNHTEQVILPENYCVFDIETKRSAQEVGGWHRAQNMGVSVAVVYDNRQQKFLVYEEKQIEQLIISLFSFDLVVGFNNKRFDNKVLSAYTRKNLSSLPSFDILEVIYNQLGYRLSLDHLAEQTLGKSKQGHGLQALEWFKQGEMEKLTAYCREDVQLTKELFLFGIRQQHLLFRNKAKKKVRLPVNFQAALARISHQ
ncbi:DEAD/DEAH box helicase [Desulfogranum marinum]|uniref:DEAD/DEAH box helicase n=1 Tax=Desulfogranum marinum TaxID=453220 RepID=UPI0029C76DF0|nr:DEAD/DEAH box helicase [Desulfogranum marinum]